MLLKKGVFLFLVLGFGVSLMPSHSHSKSDPYYIGGTYQSVTHKVGGQYGDFGTTGFLLDVGKRLGPFGIEAFYGQNSGSETKVFYGRDYLIDIDETFIGGGLRIFFLEYFNIFYGYAQHDRVIVVPPGCPFQDQFVLDGSCTGPILSGGLRYPATKKLELHAEYTLDKGCDQKRTVQAGLRVYF